MNLFNRLDKFYDIPMNNSSILKEFNLLLNNLKLKINGHIDLFAATVKVNMYIKKYYICIKFIY